MEEERLLRRLHVPVVCPQKQGWKISILVDSDLSVIVLLNGIREYLNMIQLTLSYVFSRISSQLSTVCAYSVTDIGNIFGEGKFKTPVAVETSHIKWVMYTGEMPVPRPGAVSLQHNQGGVCFFFFETLHCLYTGLQWTQRVGFIPDS